MARLVRIGTAVARVVAVLRRMRWVWVALTGAAVAAVVASNTPMWSRGLEGLNPTPRALQTLDAQFRQDLGAGDLRWLVAVRGDSPEQALTRAENLTARLAPLVEGGRLARIDSPSRFLPSTAAQARRLASIPPADQLRANLDQALTTVPFQAQALAPFLADAEAARSAAPITQGDLKGTSFALGLSALLLRHGEGHVALLALQPPPDTWAETPEAEAAQARLAAELQAQVPALLAGWQRDNGLSAAEGDLPPALFIDLQQATQSMFGSYLTQAGKLAAVGVAGVVLLLALSLRSAPGVVRVLLPIAGALAFVMAAHALAGKSLTLLHLVGLMLVVAVGSNYSLYFEQAIDVRAPSPHAPPMSDSQHAALASLLLANLATMIGFGILAFSQVPVLQAIGATVGPGALLALVLAAAWSRSREPAPA
jgi:predicted exporter